jgi:ribosome-binding factor A
MRSAKGNKRYSRVSRVNEVLRQVLAEEVERVVDTDDRIGMLTVTHVEVEPDLRHATVLLASLTDDERDALEEHRVQLQAAIARQMRLKRTPQLTFDVDPAITTGNRIEDLLRSIPPPAEEEPEG